MAKPLHMDTLLKDLQYVLLIQLTIFIASHNTLNWNKRSQCRLL